MVVAGTFTEIDWDLHSYHGWLRNRAVDSKKGKRSTFITISREFGCDGYPTATSLAEILNKKNPDQPWQVFTRPIMESIVEDEKFGAGLIDAVCETRYTFVNWFFDGIVPEHLQSEQSKAFYRLRTLILNLADKGNCILVGGGSPIITSRLDTKKFNFAHVRLIASSEFRIRSVMKKFALNRGEAEEFMEKKQNARDKFVEDFTMSKASDNSLYHLILNNSKSSPRKMAEMIFHYMEVSGHLND